MILHQEVQYAVYMINTVAGHENLQKSFGSANDLLSLILKFIYSTVKNPFFYFVLIQLKKDLEV